MANTVGGSVTWNLDAESKGFDAKIKKASKDAKDFGQELNNIKVDGVLNKAGDAFGKLGSALLDIGKKSAIAFGAATVAATGFSIKSAASFEQTRIGLENMLGSATEAKSLLKDISKFAAATPFEFPELAQATKQLVAFGFTGKEAFDTMKQLGNVSAAVGAPINDLSYLMGTLRTQGRAFTIDIRQFAQRGIPIYEYLGKVLGKNTQQINQMIEAGQIGFPEVQKAFTALAGEGGKWGDTMARQSKSLSGLFSTLKDVLGQTGRELVGITQEGDIKEGSLFARLRDGINSLTENLPHLIASMQGLGREIVPQLVQWAKNIINVGRQIAEYLQPKLETLWNTLRNNFIPAFKQFFTELLVPLASFMGRTLVVAIGVSIDMWNALAKIISPLLRNIGGLKDAIIALTIAVVGLKVIGALQGMLTLFGSGLIAATVRTVGLGSAMGTLVAAINPVTAALAIASAAYVVLNGVLTKSTNEYIKLKEAESAAAEVAAQAAATKYQDAIKAFKDLSDAALGYLDVNRQLIEAEKSVGVARTHLEQVTKRYGAESTQAKIAGAALLETEVKLSHAQFDRQARLKELNDMTLTMSKSNGALKDTSVQQLQADLKAAEAIKLVMQARKEDTTQIDTVIGRLHNLIKIKDVQIITDVMADQSIADLNSLKTTIESVPATKSISIFTNASSVLDIFRNIRDTGLSIKSVPGLTAISGARAAGGPVNAGSSYLVGERGPEIFTPSLSGEITSNANVGNKTAGFEYHIGTINISSDVDGERWLKKLTRDQEIFDNGLIPSRGVM